MKDDNAFSDILKYNLYLYNLIRIPPVDYKDTEAYLLCILINICIRLKFDKRLNVYEWAALHVTVSVGSWIWSKMRLPL